MAHSSHTLAELLDRPSDQSVRSAASALGAVLSASLTDIELLATVSVLERSASLPGIPVHLRFTLKCMASLTRSYRAQREQRARLRGSSFRLAMLAYLAADSLTPGELARKLGKSQAVVGRALADMRDQQLVRVAERSVLEDRRHRRYALEDRGREELAAAGLPDVSGVALSMPDKEDAALIPPIGFLSFQQVKCLEAASVKIRMITRNLDADFTDLASIIRANLAANVSYTYVIPRELSDAAMELKQQHQQLTIKVVQSMPAIPGCVAYSFYPEKVRRIDSTLYDHIFHHSIPSTKGEELRVVVLAEPTSSATDLYQIVGRPLAETLDDDIDGFSKDGRDLETAA